MDPHGYAVPLGSHIRRMNPRDTAREHEPAPDDPPRRDLRPAPARGRADDGVERGIAAFVICASLIRQFEFAQNVWVNDRNFHELGNERDPIIGNQDGTLEYKIPKRPIRKTITGLPAFTTVRGGAYFFLPGLKALRTRLLAAALRRRGLQMRQRQGRQHEPTIPPARTYNQSHVPRQVRERASGASSIYWTWSYPWEAQRDPAAMENRFSTMTEVRNVALARLRDAGVQRGAASCRASPVRWSCSTAPRSASRRSPARPPATRSRCSSASTRRAITLPIDERILADTDTLMVFGLDHLPSEQEAAPEEIAAIREWLEREGTCLLLAPHHDVGFTDDLKQRQVEYQHHGDALVPRQQRFSAYTRSLMKALDVPCATSGACGRRR